MESCWKSVGISKGRYEPKWEFPEGVQTKRILYWVGEGGGVWIFCGPVCFPFFYVQEMEIAAP